MSNYRPPPVPPPMHFNSNAPYLTYPPYPPYHYQQIQNVGAQAHGQLGSFPSPYQANGHSVLTNGQSEITPAAVNGTTNPSPGLGFSHSSNDGFQLQHQLPVSAPQRMVEAHPLSRSTTIVNQESGSAQVRPDQVPQRQSSAQLSEPHPNEPIDGAVPVSDLEEGELSDGESVRHSIQPGPPKPPPPDMPERNSIRATENKEDGRAVAKKALRELEDNSISFLSVAAEVVDDELTAASLQRLYAEIGVNISQADLANASAYDTRPRHKRAARSAQIGELNGGTGKPLGFSFTSRAIEVSGGLSKITSDTTAPLTQAGEFAEPLTRGALIRPTEAVSLPVAPPKDQISTPMVASSKPQTAKSNEKTFDRKNYIARMLAAKKGKGAAAANGIASTDSSLRAAFMATEALPLSRSSTDAEVSRQVTQDPGTHKSWSEAILLEQLQNVTNASPIVGNDAEGADPRGDIADSTLAQTTNEADAQAKKKAQTELARKKMEALLNRGNLQRNGQAKESITSNVVGTLPLPEIPPAPASASTSTAPIILTPVTAQPVPSFGSSMFSPISGKPLFNLPGLFMSNESPSSIPDAVDLSQNSPPKAQGASVPHPIPTSALPRTASGANVQDQTKMSSAGPPELTKSVEPPSAKALSTEVVNNTRKRQKASDFIEPPSTRVKRHLGLSEDRGVVIEVSEDEALDDIADDDVNMDVDTDQDIYGDANPIPVVQSNFRQKEPFLIETRNSETVKPNNNTVLHTPSLPSTPGRGVESNGLRTKEKEIELMNRKIAELEQRRKAKQSSSRAQTPNLRENIPSSPKAAGAAAEITEQSETALVARQPSIPTEQQSVQEMPGVGIADGENAVQNQYRLLRPQSSQPGEDPAAKLEAHRSAGLEALQMAESVTSQAQEPTQQHRPELEERQAQGLEADEAMGFEEQRMSDFEQQRFNDNAERNLLVEQRTTLEAAANAERQQNLRRISEIQAGLCLLDAEVEKTKQKLQLLEGQVKEHKAQLAQGNQGRRDLVEELGALQNSTNSSSASAEDDNLDLGTEIAQIGSAASTGKFIFPELLSEGIRRLDRASRPAVQIGVSSLVIVTDAQTFSGSPKAMANDSVRPEHESGPYQDGPSAFDSHHQVDEAISTSDNGLPLDSELAGDVMEISPSDADEGEVSEYSPEPPRTQQLEADSMEQEDVYEPPAIIEAELAMPSNDSGHDAVAFPIMVASFGVARQIDEGWRAPEAANASTMRIQEIARESPSPRSPSPVISGANDSDDYEPPEPPKPVSPLAEFPAAFDSDVAQQKLIQNQANGEKYAYSIDDHQSPTLGLDDRRQVFSRDAETRAQPKKVAEPDERSNHFTPYESPLRQFKSYRYHPTYPGSVIDGFRSLTYSHDLQHDKPVCPYETTGTCNDDSCMYQHLNRVKLSDDMILVQLGAAPKGLSSDEQEEYSKGLREVIRDIRTRKVKDFNTVAAEITAHRQKFLGDSTKVLPL